MLGILTVVAARSSGDGFFAYLADHHTAAHFVREAYAIVGQEDSFDEQISMARLEMLFAGLAEEGVLESFFPHEPPATTQD